MADGSSSLQDDELYLPRTVVNKLIKEIVPNIRVSTDARDLLLNCCTEFIHLLASEASDISERQQKKVISPEHVVEALTTLGFQEYVSDVKAVHKEYKEQASKHRKRGKSKLDRLGIPEEELARQQQQLFDEARQQQIESELLEQHKLQQSGLNVKEPSLLSSDANTPTSVQKNSMAMLQHSSIKQTSVPAATTSGIVVTSQVSSDSTASDRVPEQSTSQVAHVLQQAPSSTKPGVTQGSLPQSAAITVASLQATSNLLQQALAMASAQMAATSNAQLQQQSQKQADLAQQGILLQQPALQAALVAQQMSEQVPTKSQSLPRGSVNLVPKSSAPVHETVNKPELQCTEQGQMTSPSSMVPPRVGNAAVTSQELSVAQMMMTLAQASNRNTLALNGGISEQTSSFQHTPDTSNL